jgi:rhamnogalacturonan endolyase
MEALDRGLVAVEVPGGVFVSFRVWGTEYDPSSNDADAVSYELLRDDALITTLTGASNYLDAAGTASSHYAVRAVRGGTSGAPSPGVSVWSEPYLSIPLEPPPSGTTPGSPTCETPNEAYSYAANDGQRGRPGRRRSLRAAAEVGPVEREGQLAVRLHGDVFIDAYTLTATRLWRIDLGPTSAPAPTTRSSSSTTSTATARRRWRSRPRPARATPAGVPALGPRGERRRRRRLRSIDNAGTTGYVLSGPST